MFQNAWLWISQAAGERLETASGGSSNGLLLDGLLMRNRPCGVRSKERSRSIPSRCLRKVSQAEISTAIWPHRRQLTPKLFQALCILSVLIIVFAIFTESPFTQLPWVKRLLLPQIISDRTRCRHSTCGYLPAISESLRKNRQKPKLLIAFLTAKLKYTSSGPKGESNRKNTKCLDPNASFADQFLIFFMVHSLVFLCLLISAPRLILGSLRWISLESWNPKSTQSTREIRFWIQTSKRDETNKSETN